MIQPREAHSRLDPRVSWLFAALWVVLMVHGWGALATEDPTAQLRYPGATAARMTSRALELAEAIDAAPERERRFWQRFEATPDEALQNAIAIQEDVIAMLEASGFEPGEEFDQTRAGLAALLAEAGETDAALAAAREVSGLGDYAGLLAQLYADAPLPESEAELRTTQIASLAIALDRWPSGRLELRLAERMEDEGRADELWSWSRARGDESFAYTRMMFLANWGLVVPGLLVILGGLAFRGLRRSSFGDSPMPEAPWSFADGLGVLIRGDFFSRLYFVLLGELPYSIAVSNFGDVLYAAGTPLSSLPLLWLTYRHLIAPHRATHPDPFGVDPRRVAWGVVAAFTLAAIAAELLGTQAIGWAGYWLEVASPWTEGFDETLVWESTWEALFTSLDYVVWVPLFEELTFRGLLFFTLRRRLGVLAAALLSSAIFSGVHFYSVTGFLTTLWSGMVWALVFERVRSLIPGVTAHGVYNGLYVAGMLLLYR